MTARAPIPAAVRFEFTAPEGAAVHCDQCPEPHDLQVVDVEVTWEPSIEDGRFYGFHYSLRLTGEHPTCEIILGRASEPWLDDMVKRSFCVVRLMRWAIHPLRQTSCKLWEAPWRR